MCSTLPGQVWAPSFMRVRIRRPSTIGKRSRAYFQDAHLRYHGFIRYPNGAFVAVDASGAGAKAYQGTFVTSLNDCGETAGGFYDSQNVGHSFVRSPEGKITLFDPPGAVSRR